MPFKAIVQCLVPPVMWGAAHQIKFALRPPPPPPEPPPPPPPSVPLTEIRFSSWAEACNASSSYENELLVRFRVARFILNAGKDLIPDVTSRPLFWLTKILGEKLRITDFGGAFGEYGTGLCRQIDSIDYTVVETPALLAQSPALERVAMTSEMPETCDIFYCGGALQYLARPYEVLDAGFKSASKALVLSRNAFSQHETFRVQASPLFDNGFGEVPDGFENEIITHPLRTMREDHVHSLAAAHGFTLLSRFLEPSVFPDPEVYSAQLVFVR